MCVYMCVYMHVCACVYQWGVCMYVHVQRYLHVGKHAYVYMHMSACVHVWVCA